MDNGHDVDEASAAGLPADFRILRRIDLPPGSTSEGEDQVAGIGVVVDIETTGVDHGNDMVIELAARRFSFDVNHVITRIDRPYVWRQDPGHPLPEDIVRMTGITDADLAGKSIDVEEATRVIGSAAIRIAHNARFDRPLVESLLPGLAEREWACSIEDVGWTSRGYESAKLGWILTARGYFHDAHQAQADVDATIQILREQVEPGRTALAVLMASASKQSWTVRAFGAAFVLKDVLRGRGYRWNPLQRVWWREVRDRAAEESWLATTIYHAGSGSRGAPQFELVDWRSRYA